MRYFVNYLIYAAVLARAAAWSQDSWSIPTPIWPLLGLFGLLLFTERVISRRFPSYPRWYTLVQSLLVIGMLYISPRLRRSSSSPDGSVSSGLGCIACRWWMG